MSFEPGGLSDKLGNRYEGRWVAYQLLSLLDEKIQSVTIEAIGSDEEGVDLWIEQKDGTREAHQCKARNGSSDHWSISDLINRGVLKKSKSQLDRDPSYKFILVSSIGSRLFQDICDFTHRSNKDPKAFYQTKILQAGEDVRKCFSKVCESFILDPEKETDLKQVFDYLNRLSIRTYPDDRGTCQGLLERIDYLLTGASREVILATLLTYAESNDRFGNAIYVDELRNYLSRYNIHQKRLDHDPRIAPAIQELQTQFMESIRPLLIGGTPLKRDETGPLIKAIQDQKNVVLSGAAGYGKSGVLYELVEYLQQNNIPYLPIRLDRREPENTSDQFGKKIGLPDCPAFSLAGLAGARQSVLILDQLDAIRWTSAHSNSALDVCKELVRHVQSLQLYGTKINVILSCRTFDLEHDPSIKNWLNDKKEQEFNKVVVKELAVNKLKDIIGPPFEQMTAKEKSLLACPQNLSIWAELKQAGNVPSFQTGVGLMREFWKNRRLKLDREAGITPGQLDNVLSALIDYAETHGRISVPIRVASLWPNIIEALCSYGILQENSGQISFCHQRYLDYLIAERLLNQIDAGSGDILVWLGIKEKQSLFRREQLRQALVIMSEESPQKFLQSAKQILESTQVRFHIKHLVLEIIGFQEKVSDEIGNYCLDLLGDVFWQMHILETVFGGHHAYITYLLEKRIISQWLESGDPEKIDYALRLLQSVAEIIPDCVVEALESYIDKGNEWPDRMLKTICWNAVDDSERMFQLRLKLVRQCIVRDFIDWKALCLEFPLRAIQLIEAVASTWNINDDPRSSKNRMEQWYDQDEKGLQGAVSKFPFETWDYFMPHISRLTAVEAGEDKGYLEKWRKDRFERHAQTNIKRGIVDLTIIAGQCLAKSNADALIEKLRLLENNSSLIIQEIIIESYRELPNSHADVGIKWLLNDVARFRIGYDYHEPEWQPAMNLIKALSSYCSDSLFKELEEVILNYHSSDEKELAKYYLGSWRKGYFGHYWGEAQYFLLQSLDSQRINPKTADLIKTLRRKFYPEDRYFNRHRMSGGMVGSKLDPSLERISDRAWLNIISNNKIKDEHGHNWIQVDPEHVLESSIRQFSCSLERIAKRYPERFARLSLQFPDTINPAYVSAILDGCTSKTPDANIPENEKSLWKPASISAIESLLNKFKAGDDRETAISFCRLILARAEENWSDETISRLIYYAKNHSDLEQGKLNVHCEKTDKDATVDMLHQNSINCVRGVAAEAIARLLWDHPDWLEKLRPAIESLVQDKHPAVRIAVIEILLPLINLDKNQAVKWFCLACVDDLRVAASPRAREFLNYTIESHFAEIGPLIRKMISSDLSDVAKEGATEVAARWLFYGFFEQELKICLSGTIPQRQGVAIIASQFFHHEKYLLKCQNLLKPLLNDPDKEVRGELHGLYHKIESLEDPQIKPFLVEYIHSQSFIDSSDRFVYYLKETEGSIIFLADTIITMYEVFSSALKKESREMWSHFPHTISESLPLLLRLYEQALAIGNKEIVNRCLDSWDILYENRVGIVRNLSKLIEEN